LAFDFFGVPARDELVLRLFVPAAMLLFIACCATVAETPPKDAMLANGVLAPVGPAMVVVVVAGRSTLFKSRGDQGLHTALRPLSPGQFRRLLRRALDCSAAFRSAFVARLTENLLDEVGAGPPRPARAG
jgi:hypothetical protein